MKPDLLAIGDKWPSFISKKLYGKIQMKTEYNIAGIVFKIEKHNCRGQLNLLRL